MIFLTTAPTEEQISGFTAFLRGLTWETVVPAVISLVISLIVIKILTALFNKAIRRSKVEPTLHTMICTVFKCTLYIIALLIVTGTLGMDVSILVAVFSVVSLAISLAVQGTLANVAGGLTILTAKPFRVDDYVEIGATGGTVLSGKGTGARESEKFLGISLASEKDLVLIVADADKKAAIMKAIVKEAGPGTDAGAICFSLPVTGVEGLRRLSAEDVAGESAETLEAPEK